MNRKKLTPLKKVLCNNRVVYHWGFPMKLLVTWNVEKGTQLFKQWQLLPPDAHPPAKPSLERLETEWT